MSISEHLLARRAQAQAELSKVLELTLRQSDLSSTQLEAACDAARVAGLWGVDVSSSRVLQAATFLEETGLKVVCSIGLESAAVDADVKRFETEVAIDAGAQLIELMPNLGKLLDGEDAFVLRELRDVVEAADERPVRVALPAGTVVSIGLDRLSAFLADSGVQGLTIIGSGDGSHFDAVKQIKTGFGAALEVKAETPALSWAQTAAFLEAGAGRFATTLEAEILAERTVS